MTNAVVVARTGSVPALVAERAEKAAGYAEAAKARNTRRAYRSDWQLFETWLLTSEFDPLRTSTF